MDAAIKKRRVIRSEGREIVVRVYNFLKDEYNIMKDNNPDRCDLVHLVNIKRRTAKATGVSERIVDRFLHEERILASSVPVTLCIEDKSESEGDIDETKPCVPTIEENDEERDVKNIDVKIKVEKEITDSHTLKEEENEITGKEHKECNITAVTIKKEND